MGLMAVVVVAGRDGRGRGEGLCFSFFSFLGGSPILSGDFLSSYIFCYSYIQHFKFPS